MNLSPQLAAIAAGLTLAGAALAQSTERPWYVGAMLDVTRESNVLGTRPGTEISDTLYTATVRGGLNQPFGRQRVYADASVNQQRFDTVSGRDHKGYDLSAGFDWSTVERLSGNFTLRANQQLTDFIVDDIVPSSVANLEQSEEFNARVRLGVVTEVGFDASAGTRRVSFSDANFASRQYRENRGSLGLSYRPSGILTLGAGISAARTDYQAAAVGQTEPDRNDRQDVYLTADWVPTGASTVNARISITKIEYEQATATDFDGITGSLSWAWKPTGLLNLTTTLSRDTGQDTGFLRLADGSTVTGTDFSRVTNALEVRAGYDLTGKISMTGAVSYANRDLVDAVTAATGQEKITTLSLGARWAATRTISAGCNISRESSTATGIGTPESVNNRFGCFGQVTFD